MFDPALIDNACCLLACLGLLVGVLGAISIRLANPLPEPPADTRCGCRPSTN
jgi:hypothetical protein